MLRNKEIRQFAILFFSLSGACIVLGFAISIGAAILMAAACTAFGTAFFTFTKARYNSISQLSHQIDLVLHNADRLEIADMREGELSILHGEITKMTLRIREQNHLLKKEKEHLAHSLADIAHQLRTPLTSVNLLLSLLEGQPDQDRRKAFVREAEELLARMDWLLTALLALSRLDAGVVAFQKEPVEVTALIRAALQPLLVGMDLHNISVSLHVPEGIFLQGDSNWLSQAVQNIVKNCMESTGDNGTIEIRCTDTPLFTEITIHDNGPGFANEDLPRLFERFYRGKNAGLSGYGVGLALSRMIVAQLGGMVSAKNHPQGGALFAIRFPK